MTVEELLRSVRAELAARVDLLYKEGAGKFFKERIDLHGVRAPEVRRIEQAVWPEFKQWPASERERFALRLWESGKLEECGIATMLYRRLAKSCGRAEFRLFESWVDRFVYSWANCDGVASWLLAASIHNEPDLIGELPAWARSKNRWKRRAAIVSLLQEAKQGRHSAEIFEMADLLLGDQDDMVKKGLGWVLKEAYPKRPKEVVAFLTKRAGAPRLVLRLAAEKMTARHRAAVLGRPRP